jgi:hypothetical protein
VNQDQPAASADPQHRFPGGRVQIKLALSHQIHFPEEPDSFRADPGQLPSSSYPSSIMSIALRP